MPCLYLHSQRNTRYHLRQNFNTLFFDYVLYNNINTDNP